MNNPLTTHESALVLNFGSLLKDLNAARHGAIAQDNAWIVKKIDEASAQIATATFKREPPIPADPLELSAFLLNEKLAAPGTRVHAVLMQCQQTIMELKNHLNEEIGTITRTEEALELGYWAGPDAPAETLPEGARRIRKERDDLRRRISHKQASK